jgi:hypothetical protein
MQTNPTTQPPPAQPYGVTQAPEPPPPKPRFLAFGVPYMLLTVLVFGALAVLATLGIVAAEARDGTDAVSRSNMIPALIGWGGLMYVLVAGILCIRGHIAGLIMGLLHLSLVGIFGVHSFMNRPDVIATGGEQAGRGIAFVILATLFMLGILQLVRWFRTDRYALYEYQSYILRMKNAANNSRQNIPGAGLPQPVAPGQAPAPRPITRAASPAAPEQAFIELMGIAASVEDDKAEARLKRARQVAFKVLGEEHKSAVLSLLSEPSLIGDLEGDIQATAKRLQSNERLANVAPKAVAKVLEDPEGTSPEAHELMKVVNSVFA